MWVRGEEWGTVSFSTSFLAEFFTNLSINSVLKIFVVLEIKLMVWLLPPGHGGPLHSRRLDSEFWDLLLANCSIFLLLIKHNFNNLLSNWKLQSIVFSNICFRNYLHVLCCAVLSRFSRFRLFSTPWTVAHQAPLSMGFSRQEYWSGLPCPPPGDLPDPGIEPVSSITPALQADSLLLSHQENTTSQCFWW